jgi:hypothetical protein
MTRNHKPLFARRIGTYRRKPVYRIPVRVRFNDSQACATLAERVLEIISTSPAAAANYVRDMFATVPETEVLAYGPQGGLTHRFIGFESAIWAEMAATPRCTQLALFA